MAQESDRERARREREEIRNAQAIRGARSSGPKAANRHYQKELDDKAKADADKKRGEQND